jgi:centrin-3
MTVKIANRNPREEIDRAFDLFDINGKGLIDADDLKRIAEELGEALSDEELQSMINEFDMDDDGCITREEFVAICLG